MNGKFIAAGLVALGLIGYASATSSPSPSASQDSYTSPSVITPSVTVPTIKTQAAPKATPKQNCNPNYSGCLKPDASDYDCAGGSGNGPYYTGKVRVIGYDEYGLDRDGDGWGCDK